MLIATDIAARGIDVDNLSYVINYDLPADTESYVHRIGRTGRAGRRGESLSFCDESELDYLRAVEKLVGHPLDVQEQQPFHRAEYVQAMTLVKSSARSHRREKKPATRPAAGGKRRSFRPSRVR